MLKYFIHYKPIFTLNNKSIINVTINIFIYIKIHITKHILILYEIIIIVFSMKLLQLNKNTELLSSESIKVFYENVLLFRTSVHRNHSYGGNHQVPFLPLPSLILFLIANAFATFLHFDYLVYNYL